MASRKGKPTMFRMTHVLAITTASVVLAAPVTAQTITVGLALPQDVEGFDFVNGMYETFAEEVEANSDMSVSLVYGGALGSPNDRLSQMRRGTIEMTDAADGNYATIFSDIQVLNMPYLFPTEEVAWEVLDGAFGQKLAEDLREATGVRVLGWWESGGFKHFSANAEIHEPDDMSGLTMRVLGPLATIPVEALGASSSSVALNELYTSLQTGVVDGQDNAVSIFNMFNLGEVQSHLALTGHVYAFGPLGINEAFFDGLEPADQEVILEAAEAAISFNRETSRAAEADALAAARNEGVEVIELTDEERNAFRDVMQPPAIDWLRDNVDTPSRIDEALAAVADVIEE